MKVFPIQSIQEDLSMTWGYLWDKKIPWYLKLIPVVGLVYVIDPIDLLPEVVIPFIGVIDDIVVCVVLLRIFYLLCTRFVKQNPEILEGEIIDERELSEEEKTAIKRRQSS